MATRIEMTARRVGSDFHLFAEGRMFGKLVDCETAFIFQDSQRDYVDLGECATEIECAVAQFWEPDYSIREKLAACRKGYEALARYHAEEAELEYQAQQAERRAWSWAYETNDEHRAEMEWQDAAGFS